MLLNDSFKKAYFIELKGSNIDEAIPQLESAEVMFRAELSGYIILYRIVCSKVRAHKVNSNNFRKFRAKVGNALEYKSVRMEEVLKWISPICEDTADTRIMIPDIVKFILSVSKV